MGYGEIGGDDSVQVSVQLANPRLDEVEEGPAARVHGNADGKGQRSNKAKGTPAAGRGYRGQDTQGTLGSDDPKNEFTVTIWFTRQADLDKAKNAFANAATVTGNGVTVQFPVKVVKKSPGQVHVSWPD